MAPWPPKRWRCVPPPPPDNGRPSRSKAHRSGLRPGKQIPVGLSANEPNRPLQSVPYFFDCTHIHPRNRNLKEPQASLSLPRFLLTTILLARLTAGPRPENVPSPQYASNPGQARPPSMQALLWTSETFFIALPPTSLAKNVRSPT